MSVTINNDEASQLLVQATEDAQYDVYLEPQEMKTRIEQIIGHTHLTYKYILLTGLLAKASNKDANPIALQAGAIVDGAYDARSLCHKVVVPFEQSVLEKRLGGSNEPFLNKPARYPKLSMENAVRRGMDSVTLKNLIEVFELENGNAYDALVFTLNRVLALESRVVSYDGKRFKTYVSKSQLLVIIDDLISKSCEGETLALSIALMLDLMAKAHGTHLIVSSHPSNQSGASSKEISDIDVFQADGNTLLYCIEAKDKSFARADVEHAISKVAEVGHSELIFIFGPNANTSIDMSALEKEYEEKGFELTFISIADFAKSITLFTSTVTSHELIDIINKHLDQTRAKEITIQHCGSLFK